MDKNQIIVDHRNGKSNNDAIMIGKTDESMRSIEQSADLFSFSIGYIVVLKDIE